MSVMLMPPLLVPGIDRIAEDLGCRRGVDAAAVGRVALLVRVMFQRREAGSSDSGVGIDGAICGDDNGVGRLDLDIRVRSGTIGTISADEEVAGARAGGCRKGNRGVGPGRRDVVGYGDIAVVRDGDVARGQHRANRQGHAGIVDRDVAVGSEGNRRSIYVHPERSEVDIDAVGDNIDEPAECSSAVTPPALRLTTSLIVVNNRAPGAVLRTATAGPACGGGEVGNISVADPRPPGGGIDADKEVPAIRDDIVGGSCRGGYRRARSLVEGVGAKAVLIGGEINEAGGKDVAVDSDCVVRYIVDSRSLPRRWCRWSSPICRR